MRRDELKTPTREDEHPAHYVLHVSEMVSYRNGILQLTGEVENHSAATNVVSTGDRWLWRVALGQATLEIPASGRQLTRDALVAHLEGSERPDDLIHRRASIRAAINVLRALQIDI